MLIRIGAALVLFSAGWAAGQEKAMTPAAPAKAEQPAVADAPKAAAGGLNVGDKAPALSINKWVKGDAVKAFESGKVYVVEFWATWCPPCIAELPLLDGFYRENASKNWKVLGIAVDQLASVKGFLERSPVTFPVAMAGQGGIELARSLGNLHGGLPFSVLFGADGRILHRKMGQVTDGDLRAWLRLG